MLSGIIQALEHAEEEVEMTEAMLVGVEAASLPAQKRVKQNPYCSND